MLRIYTLGNERCAPFRFNPFEIGPGVRVELHLSLIFLFFKFILLMSFTTINYLYQSTGVFDTNLRDLVLTCVACVAVQVLRRHPF